MRLLYQIPIADVTSAARGVLEGFEGFVLVWSQDYLKVYKQVK